MENSSTFKTFDIDRSMIERKYYNPDKPHDALNRFAYHGCDYDPSTGLSDNAMNDGIAALAAELEAQDLPHPIYKAKLFEYVLDNTQIDIAAHNYFIGMRAWGRLISQHTVYKWAEDNKQNNPKENEICNRSIRSGASRELQEPAGSRLWMEHTLEQHGKSRAGCVHSARRKY